jgi:hypothetical protein
MTKDIKQTSSSPIKITREQADKMSDFATSLSDEVTHVVDYGEGLNDEVQTGKKAKKRPK